MSLTVKPVGTLEQAQELRHLRNECRGWMTRDTGLVSGPAQREFFSAQIAPGAVRAWLAYAGHAPVAYGLLRASEGCWWLSVGVTATCRGHGVGTALVRLVTTAGLDSGERVKLEVWADNERAIRVYEKAGFVLESEAERDGRCLLVMAAA